MGTHKSSKNSRIRRERRRKNELGKQKAAARRNQAAGAG
jgi:hypothetical protein